MDKKLSDEKSLMYKIFRACRLCGAGGGYKMPIVTNLPLEGPEVELRQKIRECVQIEVLEDDHMPPLICELCVDKVNDFYEFLDMCRQTNKKTRLRLGLPPETQSMGNQETDNCILGTTETIYTNNDEPQAKKKKPRPKSKKTPEPEISSKSKNNKLQEELPVLTIKIKSLDLMGSAKRPSRIIEIDDDSDISLNSTPPKRVKTKSSKPEKPVKSTSKKLSPVESVPEEPKRHTRNESRKEDRFSIDESPKKNKNNDRNSIEDSDISNDAISIASDSSTYSDGLLKRNRHSYESSKTQRSTFSPSIKGIIKKDKQEVLFDEMKSKDPDAKKKVKIQMKPPPAKKSFTPPAKVKCEYFCEVCNNSFTKQYTLSVHMQSHYVGFTKPQLACNACRDWFPTSQEMTTHHSWHVDGNNSYSCRQCYDDFQTYPEFKQHIIDEKCIPLYEVSDVKCDECWQMFPTLNLLNTHLCEGEEGRPGGKCYRCSKDCETVKKMKKHEAGCTFRPRIQGCYVEPEVKSKLHEVKVHIISCNELLTTLSKVRNHYIVSDVDPHFGYDDSLEYPYSSRPKKAPFVGMVNIRDEFFLENDEFIHWDSDSDSDDEFTSKKIYQVKSLNILCLKIIFSNKFLGKLPRKHKKIRTDINKAESILNSLIFEEDSQSPSLISKISDSPKKSDKFNIKSILSDSFEKTDANGVDFNKDMDEFNL